MGACGAMTCHSLAATKQPQACVLHGREHSASAFRMKRGKRPANAHDESGDVEPVAAAAAKQPGSSKRQKSSGPWSTSSKGWKAVDVGAELLLGAEESGFAGLEVLEDYTLLDASALANAELLPVSGEKQAGSKGKKNKKHPGGQEEQPPSRKQKAAKPAALDAASLQAQLDALKKENAALKKKVQSGQADDAVDGGRPAGKLSRKQKKQAFLAKVIEAKAAKRASKKEQQSDDSAGADAPAVKPTSIKKSAGSTQPSAKAITAQTASPPSTDDPSGSGSASEADEELTGIEAEGQQEEEDQAVVTDVSAWRLFALHPKLERGLALQGFSFPTSIQAAVLPAALQDRVDIIGAAQTGSGKTLAFGLPIMQTLLQEQEVASAQGDEPPHKGKLRALIMAPTRELAIQVCNHIQALGKVAGIRAVAIVGGLAHVKQERLLRAHPPIVVATPGRLWELLRDSASPHLSDMTALSFLVLDEADRMVQKGHFQELSSILSLVPRPGQQQGPTYDADFLPAFEAVTKLEQQASSRKQRSAQRQAAAESDEDEQEGEQDREGEGEEQDEGLQDVDTAGDVQAEAGSSGKSRRKSGGHLLQTMVFSATLTLPSNLRKRLRRGGGGAVGGTDLETLMDKVPFRGTPRIVDLGSSRRLAQGVSESYVNCLEGTDRDTVLYYLLNRHPGRTLVFANAVSTLRRVTALLKLLGIPAHAIHAQQQQRQRLKALDHFKTNPQAVLVASDVAARGLDIRDVRMVVHYQIPASVDTYIHRSGRTARGAAAEGVSVALVAPDEATRWTALCKAMGHEQPPPVFPVDASLIPKVVERIKLAVKIDEVQRTEKRKATEGAWAQRTAQEVGLAGATGQGSDDEDDDDMLRAKRLDKHKAAQLKALQAQLSALLAQPLAPRMSLGYFTGGAVAGVAVSNAAGKAVKQDGASTGDAGEAAGAGVAAAVALASKMRSSATGGVHKKTAGKKKQKVLSVEQLARMELERRSAAKQARRQKGKGAAVPVSAGAVAGGGRNKGLVVIPPAMSRDTLGQDALAVLRRKLQALG